MGDFHAIPLFSESDLEQFANGALVIHDKDVRHLPRCFPHGYFGSLHKTSRHPGQINDELRPAVFFRKNQDSPAMSLDDLVNNGKTQPSASFDTGLERLENFGTLLGVEPDASIAKRDPQPERLLFQPHGQGSSSGHGTEGVVAQI